MSSPTVLPNYSKLVTTLNTTGVQQWNPPVYNVLSQLIQAVTQSQNVLSQPTFQATKLNFKIIDVGSAALKSSHTVPIVLIPKVPGSVIVVVNYAWHNLFINANNANSAGSIQYNIAGVNSLNNTSVCFTGSNAPKNTFLIDRITAAEFSTAGDGRGTAADDIVLKGAANTTGDSGNANKVRITIAYYLIPSTVLS